MSSSLSSLTPLPADGVDGNGLADAQAHGPSTSARPAPLSTRRSFLAKLPKPGNLPNIRKNIPRPPNPARLIRPMRRATLSEPADPNARPLGTLVVRVLAGRDLMAKDKNGLSDPFVQIRYGSARVTSPTVPKSLNPVWGQGGDGIPGAAGEAKLETKVFPTRAFGRERVEIIVWDRDRLGKEYLGELNLAVDNWWGSPSEWENGKPPIAITDPNNKPMWCTLKSSRLRTEVSGELMVQIGFASAQSAAQPLDAAERSDLEAALRHLAEAGRGSREERVLLTSPTEGVGTKPIDDVTPVGVTALGLDDEDDADSMYSATDGSDLGEEDELPTAEPEEQKEGYFGGATIDEKSTSTSSSSANAASPSPPLAVPSLQVDNAAISDSPARTPGEAAVPGANRTRLALPNFLRRGSNRSVPNLKADEVGYISDQSLPATPDATTEGGPSKRFSKLRRSDGSATSVTKAAIANKVRRPRRRRRQAEYTYDDGEDLLGLVQIEAKGAQNLPRMRNMIKKGFDMDPFLVVSFGRKVFRTRVIRHSLNPVWNEKLVFQVGRLESHWNIAFSIYDWDKISSNDHVGDVSVPLEEIIGRTIQPDDRGLYPAGRDGKLIGDDFHPHDLKIGMSEKSSEYTTEGDGPILQIRAKFTPYDALRQQFWRVFMQQYDVDDNGTFTYLELDSMLDSLGSTLSKETVNSFFTRFGKTTDDQLTTDEIVICLESELRKPDEEKRYAAPDRLEKALAAPSSAVEGALGFTGPVSGSKSETDATGVPAKDEALSSGTEVVTDIGRGTTVRAPKRQDSSMTTSSSLTDDDPDTPDEPLERVINIKECPLCHKPRLTKKAEIDIVTHMGICSSTDTSTVNRIVVNEFVTASQAQRKWMTKLISKATKGAYQLGANSANIIVQDRLTGTLQEEKMPVYVRLGIRLAYKGMGAGGMEGARIRRMLESMSQKQGAKFDSPASAREIAPFIAFHGLNMDEVLEPLSSFKTFNEFFYRKLKPDARPVTNPDDPRTLVSPADCRAMFFETIDEATKIWIKGRLFSVRRLLGDAFEDQASKYNNGSLAIWRLAPQDYHRYHCPVDGICGPQHKISGQYYTVNPMAIRSSLDVYGDNVRLVEPVCSPQFGQVMMVFVGAMLVGSIKMTVNEGDEIRRGDEMGYFAFGGSTIIALFEPGKVKFDEDLLSNSKQSMETLVRVGMSIGHRP